MSGKAQIAHYMPGRIRIKIASARGNPVLLEQSRHVFDGIPGLHKIVMKPDSGSILIHYDEEKTAAFETELWKRWADAHPKKSHKGPKPAKHGDKPGDEVEHALMTIEEEAEFLASRSHLARILVDFFKDFDHRIKRATNNNIDLKIVLALALAVVTFVEIGAAAATPMWVTLALFALNHFLEIHPPQTAPQGSSGTALATA